MSNMNPWTLLVLGIFLGWLLSWLLELWFFRRRRLECQRNNSRLEAQLRARNAELGAANSQISALRGELGTRAKEIDGLLYQMAKQEDNATSEALADVRKPFPVASETSPAGDTHEEIEVEKASDTDAETQGVETQGVETQGVETQGDETKGIENQIRNQINVDEITPEQWAILRAAGITTEDDLANVSLEDLEQLFQAPEWQHVDDETWEPDAPPPETPQADGADDMTLIAGIGPKYAALLQEHGLNTFAKLGSSDAATLAKTFEGAGGRNPDFISWIEQAQAFQAGD